MMMKRLINQDSNDHTFHRTASPTTNQSWFSNIRKQSGPEKRTCLGTDIAEIRYGEKMVKTVSHSEKAH